MRIGIEAQRIFRLKKHGMDLVALELILNLQQIDKENEYVIFVKPDDDKCIKPSSNFKIVEIPSAPYPIWEQILLPRAAAKEKCDLLHCTSNTAPLVCKVPIMITLHDIIYMESISLFKRGFTSYQKFGNMYRRLVVPIVIKNCKMVITVSEFEKQRIGSFFKLSEDKLKAVYNGVGTHFTKITDVSELSRVKKKYHLPDKFIFFLGNTDPKKNVRNSLDGYSRYCQQSGLKLPLVMLDYGLDELRIIAKELHDEELPDRIILTGYISNYELPAIYSQATLMLYPSLRESFGIPVLEAMACGVPVITSNTSSLPEVSGDAAFLVDPKRPEEIGKAILTLETNDALRTSLIDKGFQQSTRFSWKAMASKIAGIYSEVAGKRYQ